jgi:hypothetical protein
MRSSKRTDKRKLLSHLRALFNDPDFVTGAKEILARKPKPFDYDGRRNDKSQINYEVGRLMAIRILRSSLCFLVALALWAVPALAQQKWWVLARSSPFSTDAVLDTCKTDGTLPSPGALYENTKIMGQSPEIADKGEEVDVIYNYQGTMMQSRYFRTKEACQNSAQDNIDANSAEKAKLDKYR